MNFTFGFLFLGLSLEAFQFDSTKFPDNFENLTDSFKDLKLTQLIEQGK
jgi:hypothetical protein